MQNHSLDSLAEASHAAEFWIERCFAAYTLCRPDYREHAASIITDLESTLRKHWPIIREHEATFIAAADQPVRIGEYEYASAHEAAAGASFLFLSSVRRRLYYDALFNGRESPTVNLIDEWETDGFHLADRIAAVEWSEAKAAIEEAFHDRFGDDDWHRLAEKEGDRNRKGTACRVGRNAKYRLSTFRHDQNPSQRYDHRKTVIVSRDFSCLPRCSMLRPIFCR